MNFTDGHCRKRFQPFSRTRNVADIRAGILTIREKWERLAAADPVLNRQLIAVQIPADIIPSKQNIALITDALVRDEFTDGTYVAKDVFEIVKNSARLIKDDFELITTGRKSLTLDETNVLINREDIFMEDGASVSCSIINADAGPVYIGRNAVIMEGCMLRGPVSIGENSVVKMGSKIYGGTVIGPYCIAGGEIKNSILCGYSNKAHDGYLGDSMIGEWCNLGAGSSNSNIKNTGGDVKLKLDSETTIFAGNKAGLLMGDYTRSAINTSFNTGTVAGVCCNIFGAQPPTYIPDFTWGDGDYLFEKALRDISNWKQMKLAVLNAEEEQKLKTIYQSKIKSGYA